MNSYVIQTDEDLAYEGVVIGYQPTNAPSAFLHESIHAGYHIHMLQSEVTLPQPEILLLPYLDYGEIVLDEFQVLCYNKNLQEEN